MGNKKICSPRTDRISNLPDDLRSYILSFLPMEDAFRTSILSKQWRRICSSLSKLEFVQWKFAHRENGTVRVGFKKFVDHVLLHHDESSIDSYTLVVKVGDTVQKTNHLKNWISFAVTHSVREFCLQCMPDSSPLDTLLPDCFFTCSSLNTLVMYDIRINFPILQVCFPMLETLKLGRAEFNNFFSTTNCPRLRQLTIRKCCLHTVTISSLSLNDLRIQDYSPNPNINLCIPNVKHLYYIAKEPPNITMDSLWSLSYAYFFIWQRFTLSNKNRVEAFAGKIQKGLCNVESLFLDAFYIQSFMRDRNLSDSPAALSFNLRRLRLVYSCGNHMLGIRLLLRSYPNLQILVLRFRNRKCIISSKQLTDGYWESKEKSAGVVLTVLKIVEFKNFNGNDSELDIVKYMLQKATMLERMSICSWNNKDIDETNRINIREKIMAFPRVSPGTIISL